MYNPNNLSNDIALIRLPQKAEFNDYVKPAKLPSELNEFQTYTRAPAVISGWGKTKNAGTVVSTLQYGKVEILDLNACMNHYLPGLVTLGNICLDTKSSGVSSCNGDSGGPLVLQKTWKQVGLTSFGDVHGCQQGTPVVLMSDSHSKVWNHFIQLLQLMSNYSSLINPLGRF